MTHLGFIVSVLLVELGKLGVVEVTVVVLVGLVEFLRGTTLVAAGEKFLLGDLAVVIRVEGLELVNRRRRLRGFLSVSRGHCGSRAESAGQKCDDEFGCFRGIQVGVPENIAAKGTWSACFFQVAGAGADAGGGRRGRLFCHDRAHG